MDLNVEKKNPLYFELQALKYECEKLETQTFGLSPHLPY